MKCRECICLLSWGVHCNFVRGGKYSERKGMGVHPPPSPAWANFSILMEGTQERGRCHSGCVLCGQNQQQIACDQRERKKKTMAQLFVAFQSNAKPSSVSHLLSTWNSDVASMGLTVQGPSIHTNV
jgi:hypothetical protein